MLLFKKTKSNKKMVSLKHQISNFQIFFPNTVQGLLGLPGDPGEKGNLGKTGPQVGYLIYIMETMT